MSDMDASIGRQIKIVWDHPWADSRARVVGFDKKFGLKVALMRNDAYDGHECFITNSSQYKAIPKNLETAQ